MGLLRLGRAEKPSGGATELGLPLWLSGAPVVGAAPRGAFGSRKPLGNHPDLAGEGRGNRFRVRVSVFAVETEV